MSKPLRIALFNLFFPPSDPAQRLPQRPPSKSKFLQPDWRVRTQLVKTVQFGAPITKNRAPWEDPGMGAV